VVPFSSGPIRDANTNQVLHHPEHKILGSGSDYTVFLDHFGVASLDFDFGKETTYGQYHSIYDSFSWMDAYGGRDEELGSAFDLMAFGAKIWGLLALRLADSAVLPIDHFVQGQALVNYTRAIEKQEPSLDLALLKRAVHHYLEEAVKLRAFCEEGEDIRQCNEKLGLTERRFLTDEGLPDRPWFKHTLQAPGMFLGYAAEVFPGIQQALDANDLKLAQQQVVVTAARIEKAASFMSVPTLMNDG
jgi:N-acetylated-alpha-linked acidic dipeptidase